jgi:hypothetical protein
MFIEDQTHFGMPRGASMTLAINKLTKIGCSLFKIKHYLQARTTCGQRELLIASAKQAMKKA